MLVHIYKNSYKAENTYWICHFSFNIKQQKTSCQKTCKIMARTFFFVCLQVIFEYHITTSETLFKPKKGIFLLLGYFKSRYSLYLFFLVISDFVLPSEFYLNQSSTHYIDNILKLGGVERLSLLFFKFKVGFFRKSSQNKGRFCVIGLMNDIWFVLSQGQKGGID